jgi:hypothetical protein
MTGKINSSREVKTLVLMYFQRLNGVNKKMRGFSAQYESEAHNTFRKAEQE